MDQAHIIANVSTAQVAVEQAHQKLTELVDAVAGARAAANALEVVKAMVDQLVDEVEQERAA